MTKINKILEYLRDNPRATNKEISEELKMDSDIVKSVISKLKIRGDIEVQGQGVTRTITVLKEPPVSKNEYKKDILRELLEIYLEEMREAGTVQEKIELGKLILKITEKL